MKRKIIIGIGIISILGIMLFCLTGCGNKEIKENKEKENSSTSEEQKENATLEIGKTYKWENSEGGDLIILDDNGNVKETAWATPGGSSNYLGTYKIEGKTLTITLTKMQDITGEWITYPDKASQVRVCTIIDNNSFEDSNGNIFKNH